MKECLECGANVEGLLYRCDCCGALLCPEARRPRLFYSLVRQTPACLNFAKIFSDQLDLIEPEKLDRYACFLERVEFDVFCFQSVSGKPHENRVAYYSGRKVAIIRIVYDNGEITYADAEEKAALAAREILKSLYILNQRVKKAHHNLDDLVASAEIILSSK